jgi:hypothetical protein
MIQVKIDVIPFGNNVKRKTVQTIDIFNDATSPTVTIGNYEYKASGLVEKTGKLANFPRFNGAVQLVYKVLKEVLK